MIAAPRKARSKPLLALHLVCISWMSLRAIQHQLEPTAEAVMPEAQEPKVQGQPAPKPPEMRAVGPTPFRIAKVGFPSAAALAPIPIHPFDPPSRPAVGVTPEGAPFLPSTALAIPLAPPLEQAGIPALLASPQSRPARPAGLNRFSIDGWMIARDGSPGGLLSGQLGGSQMGARARYALGKRDHHRLISATMALASPLSGAPGQELAVGVSSRPFVHLPLELIVEHRQGLARGTPSRLVALAATGGEMKVPGSAITVSAYGQAGVAGSRTRLAFADGQIVATGPLVKRGTLRVSAGAGIWGAAQRGTSRLDVGPSLELSRAGPALPWRLSLQWRQRVAGEAHPGSGPALTLATSF